MIPEHIAIIMDGNGRWAEARNLPRIAGHQRGVETVRVIVEACHGLGVRYLTLYAFSSENWQRPSAEVGGLMELLGYFLEAMLPEMMEKGIQLRVIGDLARLPERARRTVTDAVAQTAENSAMTLVLALSYGSRGELSNACRTLAKDVLDGGLSVEDITEELFASRLDTAGLPDPDLLIRTSGEMRISNFLLWQLAYAELYFTEICWPAFTADELNKALVEFSRRERRFGLTGAQMEKSRF
ncbi:MAG: isoprenyl transferase [Desulfuromonadaceae bacterium]|nr:isoprenyl transferase [Desulfuromonadaceae bacterium]